MIEGTWRFSSHELFQIKIEYNIIGSIHPGNVSVEYVASNAVLSDDGQYRYELSRTWDDSRPAVAFVMLNPSTADGTEDDPTIRRCVDFANRWGYGQLLVGNLFAYRASEPAEMKTAADPVGPENDSYLRSIAEQSERIIAAWGTKGGYQNRESAVAELLDDQLYALTTTKAGHPGHPLYIPADTDPTPWP